MKNIISALVQAKKEFTKIIKDKLNPYYKSKYADLDSVLAAVEPGLCNNGIFISQITDILEDGRLVLLTRLYHESGEFLESKYYLPKQEDPQKLGAAITYARRYALCAILSVTADEDDDGNAAIPSNGNGNGSKSKPPAATSNPDLVSEAQVKLLRTIIGKNNIPTDKAREIISEFGYDSSSNIKKKDFNAIKAKFDALVEQQA